MEMVVQGVSTRKVWAITEQLCGTQFSRSTVSQLCTELDVRVAAWNERDLSEKEFPFLILDALGIKVRRDGAVRSTSVLTAIGINEEGQREILGIRLGDNETEASWEEMLRWLKSRVLKGVQHVTSDHHLGLKQAVARQFQGVVWCRCQVHLVRNVLGLTPRHLRALMAHRLRRILRAETEKEARESFQSLCEKLEGRAQRALGVLEEGLEDALAVLSLPEKYRRRLRTTNMVERLHEEIRRRERVIRIFPNEASAIRLIGALPAEQHETWSTGRRYFDMEDYFEWKQSQADDSVQQPGGGLIYSTFRLDPPS